MKDIIKKAKEFATKKHKGQLDDSDLPYINHPIMVASIISMVSMDKNLIAAAYLHDIIEDTQTTYEELIKEFNQDVADLVMEVTHEGQKDEIGYYFPRLHTQRGIILKFADRLSNLSRMEPWNQKRRDQYLRKSKFWNSNGKKEKTI
jgi:GTP pyrophosphokinase